MAVTWFKNELRLPENNKVLAFCKIWWRIPTQARISPVFTVEPKEDVDIGYEQQYDDLNVVVAEKDFVVL